MALAGRSPSGFGVGETRGMSFPELAAWRFVDAVDGFEVCFPASGRLRGHTSAVEDGLAYAVRYDIRHDGWRCREAVVHSDTVDGPQEVRLACAGNRWTVDGVRRPDLDGLVDIDLEASACTNSFPVHRLDLPVGEVVRASAVYVQALDLTVRRLDQFYRRLDERRLHYTSEGGFEAELVYDEHLLVLDYPGIAQRVA